jgi:DNA-binding Xre family transcriptional regulator
MIRWRLSSYLSRHHLNANQLSRRSGLSPTTVYPIARGEIQRVDLKTLEAILLALRDMTGERVDVGDLLELEETRETGAPWETLAGLFDVPGTPTDGAHEHDRYIDEALAEDHAGDYEEGLHGQR